MGPRTSYAPGTFSWVDLAAIDTDAATTFYGALFGWEAEAAGPAYTMLRLGDNVVAGLAPRGTGAEWTSYVAIADADDVAARAGELGGNVTEAPVDVPDAGRTARIVDPQGATVALWQPRGRIGADRVNDVGCLCMNELATTDLDAARGYYEQLFGWTTDPIDTGPGGPPMLSVLNEGRLNASISATVPGTPAHWRPYFAVASTEEAVATAGDLGGETVFGPVPIPDGSFAIVRDPQGAVFGLFAGELDP